ncbi:protein IQ-DOMAIN 32-like [Benincasa hispida]|uniref:protein IQ-DOMAIN 32-like n=1 Tax=Benincasa hispida TaxID=102211 RepID=UPI001901668F|nr:protein IQ-DOMAIN 32-like [Benincasa hispida]
MGRSRSCFQVITCGSDSKDEDDIDVLESKESKDKRGWSFRKRSSQHRVLNNTVVAETPPVEKENLETATFDFQSSANSTVPEKPTIIHFTNEETHVPDIENPKGSDKVDVASENESKVDSEVAESTVIIIQAGVRGLLAQNELIKLKNVVKVQAAVRGFLVRRHAVGTLRCAQAIVKMQAIVRARHAHLSPEELSPDKMHKKNEKENPGSKTVVKGEMTKSQSNMRYISIEKLLSNSFARQLLESTPRNKPIKIKCVPSKNDSAWKWLERWMSVSSLDVLEPKKEELVPDQMEEETEELKKEESEDTEQLKREIVESHVEDQIDSKPLSETEDLNSSTIKSVSPSESEDLISYDANNLQSQTSRSPSSLVKDNLEQPLPETARTPEAEEISTKVSSVQHPKVQMDSVGLQTESNSSSDKPPMDMEQVNPLKRLAPEQLENEGKKFGSRKVKNPSFINAQAKFEQLSLAPDSIGTISSMHQDDGTEPHLETISSTSDTVPRMKEPSADKNIVLPASRITQVGGSECGTELSISSTLDSPDISEAGAADSHTNDVSKKGVEDPSSDLSAEVEIEASTTPMQNDIQLLVDQPEEASEANGHSITSVAVVDPAPSESKLERSSSDQDKEQEADTVHDHLTYKSSPEASPRSHLTVPESQGTPSSQVSIKAKRDKTDKTVSFQKQNSPSAGKKSPSSLNRNSGTRSSTDNSYKDQKTGKRRNSFEARQENVEKELKESSSSSSLPHFMQATQSARAKAHSTNSPRSSPDVQDGEYIKKRHSLPADGRQGSPRIQQPTSRTQQGAKGNEKMWRR